MRVYATAQGTSPVLPPLFCGPRGARERHALAQGRGRRPARGRGPEGRNDARTGMAAGLPAAARCVQRFDGSLNSAIHTTYRISLRSSSMPEPRDPLPKVFTRLSFCSERAPSWYRAFCGWLPAAAARVGAPGKAPFARAARAAEATCTGYLVHGVCSRAAPEGALRLL